MTCECELRQREWNPNTGKCQSCGSVYRDERQPRPAPNDHPYCWDLVLQDIRTRDAAGARKYGTRLQPHNGRDVLRDAYDEAMDLAVYLRQALFERDGR